MVDRFAKTLGVAEVYPGMAQLKKRMSRDEFGGAAKARIVSLSDPTFANAFSAPGRNEPANQNCAKVPENMGSSRPIQIGLFLLKSTTDIQ